MTSARDEGSAGLSVTAGRDGDRMRVVVVGDVDLSTVAVLRDQLDAVVGEPSAGTVVDLGGVGFMDSTGLSALVRARNRAQAAGAAFTLANLQPRVRRILEVTGLLPVLLSEDA